MKKKVVIKVDDSLLKVPMDYLTLDVPSEDMEEDDGGESLKIKGNISSLSFADGNGFVIANVPNIHSEINVSIVITEIDAEYSTSVRQAYRNVYQAYIKRHKKLKIISRVGVQMWFKYDTSTLKVHGASVKLRSALNNKELLIPNVYTGDGKICWGRGNSLPDYEKPEYMASGLMAVFLNAPFNIDLSTKELRAQDYVKYIRSCQSRVAALDWTAAEKRHLATWLDGELAKVHSVVGELTPYSVLKRSSYLIILMTSIFEDDICELAGFIHTKQIKF